MTDASPENTPPKEGKKSLLDSAKMLWGGGAIVVAAFGISWKYWYDLGKESGVTSTTSTLQQKINEQSTQISKLSVDLAVQTERTQRATDDLKKSADEVAKLTAKVSELEKNVPIMDARAISADSCEFIRQQIVSLQRDIDRTTTKPRQTIFAGNAETSAEATERQRQNDAEAAPMRKQLLAFTDRLSACTHTPR